MITKFKNIFSLIPRWLVVLTLVLVVLFTVAFFAVGWYFSSKLLTVTPQKIDYDQTVSAIKGDSYTLKGSAYDIEGIVGYIRSDGSFGGTFSPPVDKNTSATTSTRTLQDLKGDAPKVGDSLSLQGNIWTTDPKQALGIDFQSITYTSSIGTLDAWLIPNSDSHVWTIAVHGIGAQKREMLRFVRPVLAAGDTMMVISYRGDVGQPASKNGYTHLGDTEWEDVQAAVRYAKAHGATEIHLYGTSLGGSLTENYLRRSSDVGSANITKVVLDSPALNWGEILRHRVVKMGYPSFIAIPGMTVAHLRAGIDFDRITTKPGSIKQPTLIIHNADDTSVPQSGSVRVAKAQPQLVNFVDFGAGGHIRAWNHDPQGYEKLVSSFLKK